MSDNDAFEEDPLRLARLAIFCSVFGAAILLGLTMSIVRQRPPVRLAQHEFIRIDLMSPVAPGQARPRFNLRVQTPSGFECDLPLESLVANNDEARQVDGQRLATLSQYGTLQCAGLSYFGQISSSSAANVDGMLRIQAPAQGEWKFWIRWCAGDADPAKPIAVTTRISTNAQRGAPPESLTLKFGEPGLLKGGSITIP